MRVVLVEFLQELIRVLGREHVAVLRAAEDAVDLRERLDYLEHLLRDLLVHRAREDLLALVHDDRAVLREEQEAVLVLHEAVLERVVLPPGGRRKHDAALLEFLCYLVKSLGDIAMFVQQRSIHI